MTSTPQSSPSRPGAARSRRLATAAALVTAGALGATAVTGLAFASDGASGTTSGQPQSVAATGATGGTGAPSGTAAGRRAGMLRSVLHGELTVAGTDGTKVVDLQRGKLTAASATSITVASSDGFTASYAVNATTVVRKARQTVPASALAVGDEVLVRATGGHATVVRTR
jgi:hypothetical protein